MPKVSDEYIEEKKNSIMDHALQLINELPLYQITMRDIIKKTGCSQGWIYRYYKGIDEIYVDLMNRETENIDVKGELKVCMQQEKNEKEIVRDLIELLGKYILDVQQRIGGKFYFEILVSYAFDEEKQRTLLPTLVFKQNLLYIQNQIISYIATNAELDVFQMKISLDGLATFVGDTIDGISNHAALCGKNQIETIRKERMQLFHMLGDYVVSNL